jgi:hypothetical protein
LSSFAVHLEAITTEKMFVLITQKSYFVVFTHQSPVVLFSAKKPSCRLKIGLFNVWFALCQNGFMSV